MAHNLATEVSRRSVFRAALLVAGGVGVAGVFASSRPSAAAADQAAAEANLDEIAAYEQSFAAPDAVGGWTDANGVREEYRRAVQEFPLPLPDRYYFPAESRVTDLEGARGSRYDIGAGGAEAFMFWQSSMAVASYAAHLRGDSGVARRYLDELSSGTASDVGRMYLEDPDGLYLRATVAPARGGDYGALVTVNVTQYLADPTYRAIAANAGDKF